MVEYLVDRGAKVVPEAKDRVNHIISIWSHASSVTFTSQDGNTPLIWAAKKGHFSMVEYLVERRASVETTASVSDGIIHAKPYEQQNDTLCICKYIRMGAPC